MRNVVIAIVVAIAATNRFGPLQTTTTLVSAFLVFPIAMFFIVIGFIGYAIYAQSRSADRRHLADAAFGIFALLPPDRVLARVPPNGYCIFFAIPLFLCFFILIP